MADFRNFLALEASAGTGKTYNLALRFIELILMGANIHQIVALTFTNKAANEMKSRIVENFLNLENSDILATLALNLEKSESEILKIRDAKKGEFLDSKLEISTIDAFFNKILKSFALENGIDPNFTIDDKIYTAQKAKFKKDIVKDRVLLDKLIAHILNFSLDSDDFLDDIDFFERNDFSFNAPNSHLQNNENEIKASLLRLREIAASKSANKIAMKSLEFDSVKNLVTKPFIEKNIADTRDFKKLAGSEFEDELGILKDEIKKYFDYKESANFEMIKACAGKLKEAKISLNRTLNTLSFNDSTSLTHSLLRQNNITDFLYFRLDNKITHLLIDEFQDTSVLQYQIIKPLIDEIVAGAGQNGIGSFFYVGDKKQSIYGFRGGVKELFDKLGSDYKQIKFDKLDINYRSLKLLVNYVNFIFTSRLNFQAQISQNRLENDANVSEIFGVKEQAPFEIFDDDHGYIRVMSCEESMIQSIVEQVDFLHKNGANFDDIAVLCWQNKDADEIKNALNESRIPASTQTNRLLFETPKVMAVINYLKYLYLKDKIYLENVKSLVGFEPKIFKLNKNLVENLKFVCEILKINLDDENILLFFEVASRYENIFELIFSTDETKAFSRSENGVKIITVHKSKGLQYAHVILADKMGRGSLDGGFLYDYDTAADKWRIKERVKNREFVDEEYKNFKDKLEIKSKEEELNKLYVAFTRAKNSLIIIKQKDPNGNKPSYFSSYISSGKNVEYLNLKEFEYGRVISTKITPKPEPKSSKIVLENIEKQDVKSSEDSANSLDLGAIYFGNSLHYTLEMMSEFSQNSLQKSIKIAKNRYGKFIDESGFEGIERRIFNLIKNDEFLSLIDGAKIQKEVPFKVGEELRQIDMMAEKEGEILIFDYKSSKNFIEENKRQVEFYKNAISSHFGDKKISAYLLFLLDDKSEILKV